MLKVLELQCNSAEMLDHIPAIGGKNFTFNFKFNLGLVLLIRCCKEWSDVNDIDIVGWSLSWVRNTSNTSDSCHDAIPSTAAGHHVIDMF